MMRLDQAFVEFCTKCQTSADDPSHICMLFLKLVEKYWRSVYAVRKGNFWLSNVECVHWQGTCKIVGKEQYVTDGLHHNKPMYGPGWSGIDLDWITMNQLFVMT